MSASTSTSGGNTERLSTKAHAEQKALRPALPAEAPVEQQRLESALPAEAPVEPQRLESALPAEAPIEQHPLEPFLPAEARLLMLGSFPPQQKRWSMQFFYPNLQNDMWRIFGLIFFADKDHFVDATNRRFRRDAIISFLQERGIALFDTAQAVRRLQANASDRFLEIVEPTDVPALIRRLPNLRAVAATGQKAAETLCTTFSCPAPKVGESVPISLDGQTLQFFRMPSSSRAYPLALEKKAEKYAVLFREAGVL